MAKKKTPTTTDPREKALAEVRERAEAQVRAREERKKRVSDPAPWPEFEETMVTIRGLVTNPLVRKESTRTLAHTDQVERYLAEGWVEVVEDEVHP